MKSGRPNWLATTAVKRRNNLPWPRDDSATLCMQCGERWLSLCQLEIRLEMICVRWEWGIVWSDDAFDGSSSPISPGNFNSIHTLRERKRGKEREESKDKSPTCLGLWALLDYGLSGSPTFGDPKSQWSKNTHELKQIGPKYTCQPWFATSYFHRPRFATSS